MSAVSGTGTAETQAGSFTAGTGSDIDTSSPIQYIRHSSIGTSFSFSWTPPASSAGTLTINLAGVNAQGIYANTYTMTPAVTTPPPNPTLGASPTSLTFTVNGAEPPTQTVSVTSGGSPIAVTTSESTTPSANWLTVIPPGGNTPLTATVGIVATGLAAGTYNGSVSFASTGASNSPISVPVTLTVTTPIPPATTPPTLSLSSAHLNFTSTLGGSNPAAQSVMVTTSDGSAQTFSAAAAVTTPTGGTWLSVGSATGTTAASEAVSVNTTGLSAGTYNGTVTFTSSGVSNSPVTLPVTLTVNSSTPPPTTGSETFSLAVVDRLSGGTDWLLLDGSGSVNSSGTPSGSGYFTRFRSTSMREGGGGSTTTIVSSGTWTPTSLISFTPVSGSSTGGTMVLQVQITTHGSTTPSTGTLTITSTGTTAGVSLAINGGSTFNSVGIGTESINGSGGSGGTGGGGTGGGDDSGTTGGTGTGGTPTHTDN